MIPQHWQHTLSHQGHINHETQPVQAASLPLVKQEKIQWAVHFLQSYQLASNVQGKRERRVTLSFAILPDILFLFFSFPI